MSTEPVQRSHSPGTIYRCAQEGHGYTVTWPATSGLPSTTHCFRCHHQWANDLEQDTSLTSAPATAYGLMSDSYPTRVEFAPDEVATGEDEGLEFDTGELVPGYETEAWDDPVAHAWKTSITFHGMVLTVYTGSVSGSTSEEVRAYLQHEYRAAQIGTPEVAR